MSSKENGHCYNGVGGGSDIRFGRVAPFLFFCVCLIHTWYSMSAHSTRLMFILICTVFMSFVALVLYSLASYLHEKKMLMLRSILSMFTAVNKPFHKVMTNSLRKMTECKHWTTKCYE